MPNSVTDPRSPVVEARPGRLAHVALGDDRLRACYFPCPPRDLLMARPTNWQKTGDGSSEARKSNKGNIVRRQATPDGVVEHVNRKDGSTVRATEPTTDPTSRKR